MNKKYAIGKFHRNSTGKSAKEQFPLAVVKQAKEYQMHLIWLTWYNA
jgi:hypothetical protein